MSLLTINQTVSTNVCLHHLELNKAAALKAR